MCRMGRPISCGPFSCLLSPATCYSCEVISEGLALKVELGKSSDGLQTLVRKINNDDKSSLGFLWSTSINFHDGALIRACLMLEWPIRFNHLT